MKKILPTFFLLCTFAASAEDLFVQSSGTNGAPTTWYGAWSSPANISWGSGANQAGNGDTVYIAGGTYSPFEVGAAGVTIKRARATNSVCSGASGWSAGYDSLVYIPVSGGAGAAGVRIEQDNTTIDGQLWGGISIYLTDPPLEYDANTAVQSAFDLNANNTIIRYVKMAGPGDVCRWSRGIDFGYGGRVNRSGVTVQYCEISGVIDGALGSYISDWVVEYCQVHDMGPGGIENHDNLFYMNGCNNMTFRYNEFWNYGAEGIFIVNNCEAFDYGYIYGNVFRDTHFSGRGIEWAASSVGCPAVQSGSHYYVYNNTFVNVAGAAPVRNDPRDVGGSAAGAQVFNNLFINCAQNDMMNFTADYNYYGHSAADTSGSGVPSYLSGNYGDVHHDTSGGGWYVKLETWPASNAWCSIFLGTDGGANTVGNVDASTLFVNFSGKNFRLSAGTTAGFPFGSPYNIDPDGTTRGSDGTYDRGAFEFGGAAAAPDISSNNIVGGVGTNFTKTMSASGSPTSWGATNLPSALTINNSGVISGTVASAVTNQTVGLFATNATGFDVQTVLATFYPLSPVMWRSASTVSFPVTVTNGTSQSSITISNNTGVQSTTLTGYVHQFSSPFGVSGDTNYSLTGTATDTIMFTFTPTSVGTNTGYATLTGDGNQTNTLYGSAAPNLGLHAVLAYGLLVAPMTSNANNWVGSTVDEEGTVSFFFDLPVSGYYTVQATTSGATNGANNSFYVSTKTESEFIWDIFEEADGLNYVHNRGTGLYNAPQYTNYAFTNLAGQQWLQFRGREICYISNVVINFTATGGSDVTPPDTFTFNYPTNSGFTVTASTNYTGIGGTAGDSDGELLAVYWTNATTGVSGTATGTTTWTNYPVSLNVGNNVLWMTAMNTNSLSSTTNITVYWPGTVAPVSGATLTGGTLKVGQ